MTRKFWFAVRLLVYPILIATIVNSPALAQEPKWELEGHAGFSFAASSREGLTALPVAGAAFTTENGFPSRRVSSWWFGEGAMLLNQVVQQYVFFLPGQTLRPTVPLDPALHRPLIEPGDGGSFGLRVGRRLSSWLIAEMTIERLPAADLPEETLEQYREAAISFRVLWDGLTSTFGGTNAYSQAILVQPERQGRLLLTGAVNFEFGTAGNLRPYLAGGAGVMRRTGTTPTARFLGSFQYSNFPNFDLVEERDHVELTGTTTRTQPVGVVGGGVRIPLSERLGLRADARVYLSSNHDETFLSTTTPPARIAGASSGYFERGNGPAIQLQSIPRPAPDSEVSFSGPQISNLRTFEGTGMETDFTVALGAYWRF